MRPFVDDWARSNVNKRNLSTTTQKGTGMAKTNGTAGRARSKSQIVTDLSTQTGLSRKQVNSIFDGVSDLIKKDLGKKGPGLFTLPGLLKIYVVNKPATKAREGINPFTKEKVMFKAKPARRVVKARALKALKDMVG